MKKLIAIATWILVLTLVAVAQSKEEREVLKFIADYDQAYLNQNISFAERVWADDYIFSAPDGTSQNRAKALQEARADFTNPKYKLLSFKSVNDSLQIRGNTAIASGSWSSSTVPMNDLHAEPHIDNGRYTMVLEKRNGNWMVIAEHNSEAPHDKKLMEAAVLRASKDYDRIIVQKDRAAYEKLFTDNYIGTQDGGKMRNKTEEIDHMVSADLKLETSITSDRKVTITGNSSAIETGTYTTTGISKDKPFTDKGRYTTVWVFREGRWQIAADHSSSLLQN